MRRERGEEGKGRGGKGARRERGEEGKGRGGKGHEGEGGGGKTHLYRRTGLQTSC